MFLYDYYSQLNIFVFLEGLTLHIFNYFQLCARKERAQEFHETNQVQSIQIHY